MNLVRDVLDKLVVDRNGREMGRVDGIVIEQLDGMPARMIALQIGPSVLAHRLHPTLGRWVAALEQALGVAEGRPVTIDVSDVLEIRDEVKVDLSIGETAAGAVEQKLRVWIAKLGG